MSDGEPVPAYGEDRFLALSLVNSRVSGTAGVYDRIATRQGLAEWLRRCGLPASRVTAEDLITFTALRADARAILTAVENDHPLSFPALDRVNQAAGEPVRPVLEADRSIRWAPAGAGSTTAAVARELLGLASSSEALNVRTCAASDCDRMFLRLHGRQIWCSPRCGGRVRARRHAATHPPAK